MAKYQLILVFALVLIVLISCQPERTAPIEYNPQTLELNMLLPDGTILEDVTLYYRGEPYKPIATLFASSNGMYWSRDIYKTYYDDWKKLDLNNWDNR